MSKTTWILVANSSYARILVNDGPKKGLKLVKELEHPESREKRSNLVTDRPGQNVGGGAAGRGAFVSQTDPSKHEAENFALELAKELEHGRVTNSYDRLILVVSSPFLGHLNNRLGSHVQALVSDTIEKDYTKEPEKALAKHLERCIYL